MTKCKECDLYEENKLLKENLTISQHFSDRRGEYYTELRVKLRNWGMCIFYKGIQTRIVTENEVKMFWKILGEETPAERFEKERILAEDTAQKEKKENE